jgi:hypothetical protein
MAITKIVLKPVKPKWLLEFIGSKYGNTGEGQQQL